MRHSEKTIGSPSSLRLGLPEVVRNVLYDIQSIIYGTYAKKTIQSVYCQSSGKYVGMDSDFPSILQSGNMNRNITLISE